MENKAPAYRWIILLLTFLPAFFMSVCQFQATPYAADLMAGLGLTEQQYTTIATAPMLVGVFLSFIAGTLGDKFGVKRTVFVALVITTIGAVCRSFVPGYAVLLLVTVLMGVAGVVLTANNAKLMSSWFPPAQLGLALGVVVGSGNAGTILAMAIGTKLGTYEQAFLYGGIAFAIITILWLLFVKERKAELPEGMPEGAMLKVNIGDVLKCKTVWVAAIGAAFYMGVNMAVSALLSPGLIARGVDAGAASLTVIVFSVVALVGSIVMPSVIGKLPNTKITGFILALITGTTLYLAWSASSAGLRNIMIAVCAFAAGGLLPVIMSVPAMIPEIGPAKMGAAGGVITTVMMAGAFIIPSYVITPLAGGINNTTFILAAACAVIVGVVFLVLPNTSVKKNKQ